MGMSLADEILAELQRGADDGMEAVAHLIAEDAKRNAPVGDSATDPHPGELRDSIEVERNAAGGFTISANTPYAAKQHEAIHFKHRQGKAKFLEHPLQTFGKQLDRFVAEAARRRIGG
jgi:hypothetical protein